MSNVVVMNNPYADRDALKTVMYYGYKSCMYWGGYGIRTESIESAIESMKYIKKYYDQEDGKQLCHIIVGVNTIFDTGREYSKYQSYADGAYLDQFADTMSAAIYHEGYQNCYFRHADEKYRPHVHYVINTVNLMTGKKLASHTELAQEILGFLYRSFPKLKWQKLQYNKGEEF